MRLGLIVKPCFLAEPTTCVFWDGVDFPFPNDVCPHDIYQNMKFVLRELGLVGEFSIKAYVDEEICESS